MPAGNSGVQMTGWFKKPVNSLADFNGLKMRIPGLGGKILPATYKMLIKTEVQE